MRCLLIADPANAETMLAQLRTIAPGVEAELYTGGSLRRQPFELVIIADHLTARGINLGGERFLSPLAAGSVAATARAKAIFVASCDGPTAAIEIANQAKSTAVVYYPATLDPGTAWRIAVSFAEEFYCVSATSAVEAAQAAGYEALNPIWTMPDNSGSFGNNPDLVRMLIDLQRSIAETQAELRHVREDVATLKTDVRRIGDTQTAQNAQTAQGRNLSMTPSGIFWAIVVIGVFSLAVAVILTRLSGVGV